MSKRILCLLLCMLVIAGTLTTAFASEVEDSAEFEDTTMLEKTATSEATNISSGETSSAEDYLTGIHEFYGYSPIDPSLGTSLFSSSGTMNWYGMYQIQTRDRAINKFTYTTANGTELTVNLRTITRMYMDGVVAYCIRPGRSVGDGDSYSEADQLQEWDTYLTNAQRKAISMVVALGYPMQTFTDGADNGIYASYGDSKSQWQTSERYAATQLLVWEILMGHRSAEYPFTLDTTKTSTSGRTLLNTFYNASDSEAKWPTLIKVYNEILEAMREASVYPSFACETASAAQAIELQYNSATGKYEASITDFNGVLKDYTFTATVPGITFTKSGNTLNISTTAATAASIGTSGITVSATGTALAVDPEEVVTVWYAPTGSQEVITPVETEIDPLTVYIKLTAQASGELKLIKTATNGGTVAGWHFEVKNSSGTVIGTYVTDSTGIITLDLEPGTYTVTETDGEYEYWHNDPTPVRTVTVKAGETAKVIFQNQWVGKAKIVKTATNGGTVESWTFTIKDADRKTVGSYTTDSTGTILVDLEPGTYTVQETDRNDPYWYCDTEPKTVTVKAGETATVTFRNEWIGKAKIIKTLANPEAGSVEGWTFTIHKVVTAGTAISAEHLTTVTTGADGTILQDLEPGEYIITEVLEDGSLWECITEKSQTVIVEAGSTTEISFTNALRPGEIHIQKVDTQSEPLDGVEFLLEWSEDGINWSYVTFTDSTVPQIGGCTTEGLTDGKLVTGKDGYIEFSGLYPLLQYRLTETATKDGYQLLADYAYEGDLSVENDLTVSITVVNAEIFTLPKTGSKSLVLMPLSILLCLGICAAALFTLRKKKEV